MKSKHQPGYMQDYTFILLFFVEMRSNLLWGIRSLMQRCVF